MVIVVVIAELVSVKNESFNINGTAIEHLKLLLELLLTPILSPLLYCAKKSNRCIVIVSKTIAILLLQTVLSVHTPCAFL